MKRKRKPKQQSFVFKTRGGVRKGAGRPRKGRKAETPHTKRPPLSRAHPVHVTIRLRAGLPSLRTRRMYRVIRRAFLHGGVRFGFRLCHYSIMKNHMHLVCEAKGKRALARGMQGLMIRLAKGINHEAGRAGTAFAERYHVVVLKSPTHVRHALRYALCNLRRHKAAFGKTLPRRFVDAYSSGMVFDGWRESWARRLPAIPEMAPVAEAKTWLLSVGWRKAGLIGVAEVPGSPS